MKKRTRKLLVMCLTLTMCLNFSQQTSADSDSAKSVENQTGEVLGDTTLAGADFSSEVLAGADFSDEALTGADLAIKDGTTGNVTETYAQKSQNYANSGYESSGYESSNYENSYSDTDSTNVTSACANGDHHMSEWFFCNEIYHRRYCTECQSEDTEEFEMHSFDPGNGAINEYTCKCGYTDERKKDQVLSEPRTNAKTQLATAAAAYEICGSAIEQILADTDKAIEQADTIKEIEALVADALSRLPDAALNDARSAARQQMDKALERLEFSDELLQKIEIWNASLDTANSFQEIQDALNNILNNEIPAFEAEHPYINPLSYVLGIYQNDDSSDNPVPDQYVIVRTGADGSYELVTVGTEGETILDYDEVVLDDNEVTVWSNGQRFIFSDGTLTRQITRHLFYYTKLADPVPEKTEPDNAIPLCPQCHAEMLLESTEADGCTWYCDTVDCGAVTRRNHVPSELCVCSITCIHDFSVDGFSCSNCDYVSEKRRLQIIEAAQEAERRCEAEISIPPKAGTYHLYFNLTDAGAFTLTPVTDGWAISDNEGYLTIVNGILTHSDQPAAWTYQNGVFSKTIKTPVTGFLGLLIRFRYTTYYLASATTVSTRSVKTEIHETQIYDTHAFSGYISQNDGTHQRTCTGCGKIETTTCSYDPETGHCICGAYDPALMKVTISCKVEKITPKYLLFFSKPWYRATINTIAEGTTVRKVEYSTNHGKTWIRGTGFTSYSPITSILVRATDANGKVYTYSYPA